MVMVNLVNAAGFGQKADPEKMLIAIKKFAAGTATAAKKATIAATKMVDNVKTAAASFGRAATSIVDTTIDTAFNTNPDDRDFRYSARKGVSLQMPVQAL